MNHRPLILRLAPISLRTKLYYHLYRGKTTDSELFNGAPLEFARKVRMDLKPSDEGHACIAFTGFYELGLSRKIVSLAKRGGLLVDVGANYGYFSLIWASCRSGNQVIAYEASSRNHSFLRFNIDKNNLSNSIQIRTEAVGKEECTMEFYLGPENQTGWGGLLSTSEGGEISKVPVVKLDDQFEENAFINVLKIDIEGADFWALEGAKNLLQSKRIGHVFYEENQERMKSLGIKAGEAKSFLESLGYRVLLIEGGHGATVSEFEAVAT